LAAPWQFVVFDEDVGDDDTITQSLEFQFTEDSFVAGTNTSPGLDGLVSMTVSLTRQ
jgi:hypothetical protein